MTWKKRKKNARMPLTPSRVPCAGYGVGRAPLCGILTLILTSLGVWQVCAGALEI